MNKDVKLMLKIYQTKDKDWMGYKVCRNCMLTKHHIFKKVYGGPNDISNYALLIDKSHQLLHHLENIDLKSYLELNKLFRELNDSMQPPTVEYYEKVDKILKKAKYKK